MRDLDTLFETYQKSIYQKDQEAFLSIYDEQVRVFDMWERWTYEGIGAWRDMVKNWFAVLGTDRDVILFDDIQIQTEGDLAFATALVRFSAVSEEGKELRHLENRLTWVARKKKWILEDYSSAHIRSHRRGNHESDPESIVCWKTKKIEKSPLISVNLKFGQRLRLL